MAIANYQALFSLIGTQFGGDGVNTFALPDLRGRIPMGMGAGPGLSNYVIGQAGGTEGVSLSTNQIPQHTHAVAASSADHNDASPAKAFFSASGQYNTAANATMNPLMLAQAGGGQPHENRQPVLGINWMIALDGIYPSRP